MREMSDDGETSDEILKAALCLWQFHSVGDPIIAADVIVGLGSYDLRVADRCAALFTEGVAPHVLFTGASGNWTGAMFADSEAETFAARAMAAGVPPGAITLETQARNIGENLRFSARLLADAQSVLIVTKPQTQLRCRAAAALQWPDVDIRVTAPLHNFDTQPLPHHDMQALLCEMVGDLERIRVYPALGFQAHVDIPAEVVDASNVLVAAGYTDHLPDRAADGPRER